MRARFVGNGDSDPDAVVMFGVRWERGVAQEVPPAFEGKVRGNTHFETVRGRKPKAKADDQDGE